MARILLFTLLTLVLVQADEAKLSIRTLLVEGETMPGWLVVVSDISANETESKALGWPSSQPSKPLELQSPGEIRLVAEDGTAAKTVKVPEGAREVLLLGMAAAGDKEARVIAVADKFKQAKFNDWLVINLSEFETKLTFGKDRDPVELKSGDSGIYKVEGEADKGGEVTAHAKIKGEFRKIYSTFWSATGGQRSLVLIQDSGNRTKVKRISDFLPTE
jgi:hypothetical protein